MPHHDLVAIAIKTKDRRPTSTNYLGATLSNLRRAGVLTSSLLQSLTVVDSGSPHFNDFISSEIPDDFELGLPITYNLPTHSRTLHQNAATAIRIVSHKPVRWCMVMEDDIDVCDNFLESAVSWLNDHHSPSHLMYAFGANYEQIIAAIKRGQTCWPYPVHAFYGAQCLAWHVDDARQLGDWLGPDPHYDEVRDHGHDLLLQRWGADRGITHFLATAPSMVQHIGKQSGIDNKFFYFESWPGRSWRYHGQQTTAKMVML